MAGIGIIDAERLRHIPKSYHSEHEFCFHLHDLMVGMLRDVEAADAQSVAVTLGSEEEVRALEDANDIMEYLATTGRGGVEQRAMINHLTVALFSDMLHFVYEALVALEKRKFTVAYALLRKPLKEGLIFAAWMCANEEDFFAKLKANPREHLDPGRISPEDKIRLLSGAIEKSRGTDFADAEFIHALVYDKRNRTGLAPLFDKATHLVTTHTPIATEDYNLNFIFKDPRDNDLYESHYPNIAMVLLFLHFLQVELCGRMDLAKDKYLNWSLFTSLGAYESLFIGGRSRMVRLVNSSFKEFMSCQNCEQTIRLLKSDAARFFVAEMLHCRECGADQAFPLTWLLSKVNIEIS